MNRSGVLRASRTAAMFGSHRPPLQSHRSTYKLAPEQRETPWIMRGACDTDALVGHYVGRRFCVASEAVSRVGAQIHFMMTIGNPERLRQLARSRAKTLHVIEAATLLHLFEPSLRL